MNNLSVRPVQAPPAAYYPVPMRPVQFAPLPDLFQAMPQDNLRFQPRPQAPMPAVQYGMPGYQLPANLVKQTEAQTYSQKFSKSLERLGQAQLDQLDGAGQVLTGAAQATVYAPLGALEAAGRTAVAITGGRVVYDQPSPLQQMGQGFEQMGEGTGKMAVATGKQVVAAVDSLAYAPLAAMEVTAHGAGMVVGGAVKAGSWVSKQVSESFVGKEFAAGYREMMPSRN